MAKVEKYGRIIIKRSTVDGLLPKIPLGTDHTQLPAWDPNDIYVGELFLNEVNQRLWIRVNQDTIREISLLGTGTTTGITSGTSGSSGVNGTSSLSLTGTTDYQIIMWTGGTWQVSNKLIEPGSFIFNPTSGIIEYETPESGHYEIAIFGNASGLTNVQEGDILVFKNGYWVNTSATFSGTDGTSGSSGINGLTASGTTLYDFLIWSGNTWVSMPGIIGVPTDGSYSTGFFDTWTGTTKIADAMDNISDIIKKLAPAKPPELNTKTIVLSSSYPSATLYRSSDGSSVSYLVVSDLVSTNVQLTDMSTSSTGGGFNKDIGYSLTSILDSAPVGAIYYSDGLIHTGTTNNLQLTAIEYDYWGGVGGKSDFWPAIVARINNVFSGLSYGIHTTKLTWYLGPVETQATNLLTMYYDNPTAPSYNSLTLNTSSVVIKWISGVPTLSTNDTLVVAYNASGLISQVYKPAPLAASSSYTTTVSVSLSGTQTVGGAISGSVYPVVQINKYVEDVFLSVTATNAKGVATTNSNLRITTTQPGKTLRIDTVSNESTRKLSGGIAGDFPVTYGSIFNSGSSLLTGDYLYELQMLNGVYRRITGKYTTNYPVVGPDYTTDTNTDYRWVMFQYSITTKSSVNVTVVGTGFSTNAGTQVTSNLKMFSKAEGFTGWIDSNNPYPGVGIPISDGDYAMVTANSTSSSTNLLKYVTFSTNNYSGTLYVRVGIPYGSGSTITSISVS